MEYLLLAMFARENDDHDDGRPNIWSGQWDSTQLQWRPVTAEVILFDPIAKTMRKIRP